MEETKNSVFYKIGNDESSKLGIRSKIEGLNVVNTNKIEILLSEYTNFTEVEKKDFDNMFEMLSKENNAKKVNEVFEIFHKGFRKIKVQSTNKSQSKAPKPS